MTIFRYYYRSFVVWLHIEVRSVPTRQLKVSCISGAWATIEHRSLNMIFCVIFWILLEVRIVEVRFSFPKQVEVQLNDRKYQIFLKILENHRWQLIWCQLHVKNLLGVYKSINLHVTSQGCRTLLLKKYFKRGYTWMVFTFCHLYYTASNIIVFSLQKNGPEFLSSIFIPHHSVLPKF